MIGADCSASSPVWNGLRHISPFSAGRMNGQERHTDGNEQGLVHGGTCWYAQGPLDLGLHLVTVPGPWDSCGHQARASQDGAQCRHPAYDISLDTASCCHPVLLMPEADGKG